MESWEIAIGRFILEVGPDAGRSGGAALREARRAERAHFRPRPSPIMLRPRPLRGLVDRRTETAAALSAIDAGLPVEVSGPAGAGKTAFLRHLAHHPRADAFVDGIVYLSARHRTALDLQQQIFEAFYESDTICKPTAAEIRRALQDKHALILVDDVALSQNELEDVLDVAPPCAFVVASRERCLWGEVRGITFAGLAAGDPVAELMTTIDDKHRRVLLALSALSPVAIEARHVSGLAELPDVEPAITGLVDRGLVLTDQSRYRLADGVRDRLRRTADLMPPAHRAVTYFLAWAERHGRNRVTLLEASDALLRVQQHAADTRRWGEALALGRLLEAPLVVSARWGDWELALDRCLAAAKAMGDKPVEAWGLHQLGTRAVCLGDEGTARRLLTQSAALRDTLGEYAAAALSRRNLGFLPAVVANEENDARDRLVPAIVDTPAFDALPFRSEAELLQHRRTSSGAGGIVLTFVACAMLGGLSYLGTSAALSSGLLARFVPSHSTAPQARTIDAAVTPQPRDMTEVVPASARETIATTQRANIRIFTARPGSIATTRPSSLCYAVSDAAQARIEPGVGEVDPAATLTCRRVAPVRTTTYELSATGRDGVPVTQRVVIVVR